jgi:hypothetical protein
MFQLVIAICFGNNKFLSKSSTAYFFAMLSQMTSSPLRKYNYKWTKVFIFEAVSLVQCFSTFQTVSPTDIFLKFLVQLPFLKNVY